MTTETVIETWAPIPFAVGYEVSTLGQVRSWIPSPRHGPTPRILKPTAHYKKGYLAVGLRVNGRLTTFRVHRLVAEVFIGPLPHGMQTRHLDGDPTNNAVANLAYGTQSENEQDKLRHGRHWNASKAACKRGHPLVGDHVYVDKHGYRRCQICRRELRAIVRAMEDEA